MKSIILFLLPKRFDAITLFSKVYAREGASEQLLNHESVHAEQQRMNPFMFYLWYAFSKKKRAEYEAEAYAKSVHYGMKMDDASRLLAFNYGLNISMIEAKEIIMRYLK